jgi:DNA (cytosine-5)-methyltransferase 1
MRIVDLFSGCGGLSLGFQQQGNEVLLALDNLPIAVEIYNKNFDHNCILHDISDVNETVAILKKIEHDMVIGGPPCQDFSSAGPRNPNGKRANLTYSFMDIVLDIKPKVFVMENVPAIKNTEILIDICNQFQAAGYGLTTAILNAALCGSPQRRKRFILIGEMDACNNKYLSCLANDLASEEMTVRDYFGDQIDFEFYYRHPRSYARRGVYSIDEPSATIRGVDRPIPSTYKKHKGDKADPSSQDVRVLTAKQRAMVQTFPEDFIFSGIKSKDQILVGNAVPVKMANYIASAIAGCVNHECSLNCKEVIFPTTFLKKSL